MRRQAPEPAGKVEKIKSECVPFDKAKKKD